MIGYHYTSEANWRKIRQEGLRPYALRPDIVADGQPGIWLFTARQTGQSHAGCIFFQIKQKKTLSVVELAVAYVQSSTQRHGWTDYTIAHTGVLETGRSPRPLGQIPRPDDKDFIAYYHRQEPATIVWDVIPPEAIQLLGTYHFQDAWTQTAESLQIGLGDRVTVQRRTV